MAFVGLSPCPCSSSSDSHLTCHLTSGIARVSKRHSLYLSEFGGSSAVTPAHRQRPHNVVSMGGVEAARVADSRTPSGNTQVLFDDASSIAIDGAQPAGYALAVLDMHDYESECISEADLLRLQRARLETLGLNLFDFDGEDADHAETKEGEPLDKPEVHGRSRGLNDQRYTRKGQQVLVRSAKRKQRLEKRERARSKAINNSASLTVNVPNVADAKTLQVEGLMPDPVCSFLSRNGSGSPKLLTAAEEVILSNKIQDLVVMNSIKERLQNQLEREPTMGEWAAEMQMKLTDFTSRLADGQHGKNKMIQCNLRLVTSVARKYEGKGLSLDDLIQEGRRGLIRGCEKFDPKKGCKFSTYAHWWIMQAITRALALKSRVLRIPFHASDAILAIKKAKDDLKLKYGLPPSDRVISKYTGISTEKQRVLARLPRQCRSFDKPVGRDLDINLAEMIADPSNHTSESQLLQTLLKDDVDSVLKGLKPMEREVIRLRYGLNDGKRRTLKEIGKLCHISRESARQIEGRAMQKLKDPENSEILRGILNDF